MTADAVRSFFRWLRELLFPATAFLSAALLFSVQPQAAQRLLPRFGGAPAVWTACLVFFQASLLLGYLSTDRLARWFSPRWHAGLQVLLLSAATCQLPLQLQESSPGTSPALAVLATLTGGLGGPFLVLSMMAPLLQRLFVTRSEVSVGATAYRLYAASNAGSLCALIAYPCLIEPHFTGTQVAHGWAGGYGVLIGLLGLCLAATGRNQGTTPQLSPVESTSGDWSTRLSWLWQAFLPACQMTACTSLLTTEILPVPLLWVLPLAVYLATYILAFSVECPARVRSGIAGVAVTLIGLTLWSAGWRVEWSPWGLATLHLGTLGVCSLVCHQHLAATQPEVSRLTEYYVWLALGGVLAGIVNAFLAPQLFPALYEYPLTLVLVAATLTPAAAPWGANRTIGWGLAAGAITGAFAAIGWVFPSTNSGVQTLFWLLPFLPSAWWWWRGERLALTMTCALATIALIAGKDRADHVLSRTRSFFGAHRIYSGVSGKTIGLSHGGINHGLQFHDPSPRVRRAPLGYYFATSPIGQVFIGRPPGQGTEVGIVGLGIGTLAAYGRPGERFEFFEIDAAVADIARDPRYFTHLRDSPAETLVHLGDARLTLADQPDGRFDLLVIDAFTGDAIPQHLLTREAFALYRRKLRPDGLLAVHLSSLYVWLPPVVAAGAHANGWDWRLQVDSPIGSEDRRLGKLPSIWMIASAAFSNRRDLVLDVRWTRPPELSPIEWTDDSTSIWRVWRPQGSSH